MAIVDELARKLRLAPWAITRRRELELYLEARGPEALERQVQLAIANYPCCWQSRAGQHHPACPNGGGS